MLRNAEQYVIGCVLSVGLRRWFPIDLWTLIPECPTKYHELFSSTKFNKKPHKGADGHRRQHSRLVAAYLQSQSQAYSLGQRGDKTQWILVISTFRKLRSHVSANWGRNSEIWLQKLQTRSHTILINHWLRVPRQNS